MNSIPFRIVKNGKEVELHPGYFEFDSDVGKNYIRLSNSADVHTGDILKCSDGKFSFFVLSVNPIYEHNGSLQHLKIFYESLEERSRREAEEAKKQKSQFRHDWLLTTYSLLTGAIAGALVSILFNLVIGN